MPETLEIRNLSGTITLGANDDDAHILVPRIEYEGCMPWPKFPRSASLNFLSPYNREIKEFLVWLNGFNPTLRQGSMRQCVAVFEPFMSNRTSPAFFHPASFGSVSLKDDLTTISYTEIKTRNEEKNVKPKARQIGEIGRRVAASRVIQKYFSCEERLKDLLKPYNGELTQEAAETISDYPYCLRSYLTSQDFENLIDILRQFFYLDKDTCSLANSIMEKFAAQIENPQTHSIKTYYEGEVLLHQYLMWSIIELSCAIIVLMIFGELEMAEKLKKIIESYESGLWPLCLLEHSGEQTQPHSTTILLLCS